MDEEKSMRELLKECHSCDESEGKPFAIATAFNGKTYCPYCNKFANYDSLRGEMTTGEFIGIVSGEMNNEARNTEEVLKLDEEDIIFEDKSYVEE